MQNEPIISVRVLLPPAYRLFVFQSAQQFFLFITILCLTYVILSAIPFSDDHIKRYAFWGAFGGVLSWIVSVLPASLDWRLKNANARVNAREDLANWLRDLGYTEELQPGVYVQRLPAWARGENQIVVRSSDLTVNITGPWMIMRRIRGSIRSAHF